MKKDYEELKFSIPGCKFRSNKLGTRGTIIIVLALLLVFTLGLLKILI